MLFASDASVDHVTRGDRALCQSRTEAIVVRSKQSGVVMTTTTPIWDLCPSALAQLESPKPSSVQRDALEGEAIRHGFLGHLDALQNVPKVGRLGVTAFVAQAGEGTKVWSGLSSKPLQAARHALELGVFLGVEALGRQASSLDAAAFHLLDELRLGHLNDVLAVDGVQGDLLSSKGERFASSVPRPGAPS